MGIPFWIQKPDGGWRIGDGTELLMYKDAKTGDLRPLERRPIIHPNDLARLDRMMGERRTIPNNSSEAAVTAIVSRWLDLIEAALAPAPVGLEAVVGEESATTRDRFAMAALQGLLAQPEDGTVYRDEAGDRIDAPLDLPGHLAKAAYHFADAMMAARDTSPAATPGLQPDPADEAHFNAERGM